MNASTRPQLPLALDLELIDESGVYVSVGDLVDGKFRVEEVLGIGGMGFVVAATHIELDERFALKFLARAFLGQAAVIERFTQEARAACRLRSEHIARVHDVGVHDGAPFMVMEHLRGRDLAGVMAARGALPIPEAVEYVMQACEALAVAHRRGIIHRDIKPENLFLVEHEGLPSVKLLDFGISRLVVDDSGTTSDGMRAKRLTGNLTLGTPWYMAPEQIRSSADADARSDQWSLAVVLYELLTGTEAFRAPSANEVCAAVLEREPVPIEHVRDDVPADLAAVVRRCLAKNPEDRFEDVAALAAALLPFAPSRALVSAERSSSLMRTAVARDVHVSSVRVAGSVTGGPASQAPTTHSVAAGPPPRRWPVVAGAVALGAIAIAAFVLRPPVAAVGAPVSAAVAAVTIDAPIAVAAPASARPLPSAEIVVADPPRPSAAPAPAPVKRVTAVVASAVASTHPRLAIPSATESAAPRAAPAASAAGVELGY